MSLLLRATGENWQLEIIGRRPEVPTFISSEPQTSVLIGGFQCIVEIRDSKTDALRQVASGTEIAPLFFESVGYDFYFEYTRESKISLPLGSDARRIRDGHEHYFIDFRNNIGFADIRITSLSGETTIRIEVFPRKIDYCTDYKLMIEDISSILSNLAMTTTAKTFGLAAPSQDHRPTLVEWFALLSHYFAEFLGIANSIVSHPQSTLRQGSMLRDTNRARIVSRLTLERTFRQGTPASVGSTTTMPLPRRIKEDIHASTFDTPENRYFKGMLELTFRSIRTLLAINESEDEDRNRPADKIFFESIRPGLRAMSKRIEPLLRSKLLTSIGAGSLTRPTSMILFKLESYARFDKLARLLNSGLSFIGNTIPIGKKDVALLYEYWCFIKIVDLLRRQFELREQSIIRINQFRTVTSLAKGKTSAVRYEHRSTGASIYLVYNRLFERLPTISQRPDNVIQLANSDKFYILDAKYRIQFDKDYIARYGSPGPTTEDINSMHRYRDAIAIPHPMHPHSYQPGSVIGAAVLFPYNNELEYRNHKFYNSLGLVEIGGLPFLPSATTLVEAKLTQILEDTFPR